MEKTIHCEKADASFDFLVQFTDSPPLSSHAHLPCRCIEMKCGWGGEEKEEEGTRNPSCPKDFVIRSSWSVHFCDRTILWLARREAVPGTDSWKSLRPLWHYSKPSFGFLIPDWHIHCQLGINALVRTMLLIRSSYSCEELFFFFGIINKTKMVCLSVWIEPQIDWVGA